MLKITIPAREMFDEVKQEFINTKEQTLQLEHSLVSLSKWESKWHKPFIDNRNLSTEETIDYIRCMTLTQNVDPEVYQYLSKENIKQINEYISDPMTATTFSNERNKGSGKEVLTSEILYYDMIALGIPFECQKWHLNRLITLIKVCSIKQNPPQKMSKGDIMRRNAELNAARRKQFNTKG